MRSRSNSRCSRYGPGAVLRFRATNAPCWPNDTVHLPRSSATFATSSVRLLLTCGSAAVTTPPPATPDGVLCGNIGASPAVYCLSACTSPKHHHRRPEVPEHREPKRMLRDDLQLTAIRRRCDNAKEDASRCRQESRQAEPFRGDTGAEHGNGVECDPDTEQDVGDGLLHADDGTHR